MTAAIKVRAMTAAEARGGAKAGEILVLVLDEAEAKRLGVDRYTVARFNGVRAVAVDGTTYRARGAAVEAAREMIAPAVAPSPDPAVPPWLTTLRALSVAEQKAGPRAARTPEMAELLDRGFAVPSLKGYAITPEGRDHLAAIRRAVA